MDDTFSSLYARASEALEIADGLPESLELFNNALRKANKPVQKAACFRGRSLALQQLGCARYKYAKNENILKSALRDALVAAQLEPQFTDIAQIAQWHIDHKVAASPGTLRWIDAKSSPPKLPVKKNEKSSSTTHGERLTGGWKEYLEARAPDLIQAAKHNPAIIDGLSCPLSLAYALQAAQIFPQTTEDKSKSNSSGLGLGLVNIIVLGASEHCEQAVLERTNYWEELGAILGCERLKMWFVGPEMRDHKVETPSFAATCRKISAPFVLKRFLEAHPEVPESAPVCVFNGGFGNQLPSGGTGHLLHSWLPCLRELTESSRICIFFCANDYADVQGECFMHSQVFGSRFILLPQRNPFSMASVHCSKVPSQGDQELSAENDWFQGNAFVYATQSYDAKRRKPCVDWKRAWSKAQDVAAAHDGNLPGLDKVYPVLPPLLALWSHPPKKNSGVMGNPVSSTAAVKNKSSTSTRAAPGPTGESTGSNTYTLMKEIPSTTSTSTTSTSDGKAKPESKGEDASSITAATNARYSTTAPAPTTATVATTATASTGECTRGHDASSSITASTSSSSWPTMSTLIHVAERSTTSRITPLSSSSMEKMEPWAGNGEREEMCEKTVSINASSTPHTETTADTTTAPTASSTATTEATAESTAATRSTGGSEQEKSKEDGKGRRSGKFTIGREDEEGLVVFFQFEHAHNMHEVDADVSSTHLRLAAPGCETLEFAFSQPIDEAGASIKFSKKTKGLTFSAPWKI